MGREIERKYLIKDSSFKELAISKIRIIQGYISRIPERTVRIRIADDIGYITVKGLSQGMVRQEFEYQIPVEDARELIGLCETGVIDKTRYIVDYDGQRWEIDEFNNLSNPLVVAEIELQSEDEIFSLPDFIGEEVTGNPIYYNSNLCMNS